MHQDDNTKTYYDCAEGILRLDLGGDIHHGPQKQKNGRKANKTECVGFEVQSSDVCHRARENANGERNGNQTHCFFRKSLGFELRE